MFFCILSPTPPPPLSLSVSIRIGHAESKAQSKIEFAGVSPQPDKHLP